MLGGRVGIGSSREGPEAEVEQGTTGGEEREGVVVYDDV